MMAVGIQVVLSWLFFLSAWSKTRRPQELHVALRTIPLPGPARKTLAIVVILSEFGYAVLVLLPIGPLWKVVSGLAMVAAFSSYLIWKSSALQSTTACTCFGAVQWLNRFPLYRNALLAGMMSTLLLLPAPGIPPYGYLLLIGISMLGAGLSYTYSNWRRNRAFRTWLIRSGQPPAQPGKYLFISHKYPGLGEVENRLAALPAISDTTVVWRGPAWWVQFKTSSNGPAYEEFPSLHQEGHILFVKWNGKTIDSELTNPYAILEANA